MRVSKIDRDARAHLYLSLFRINFSKLSLLRQILSYCKIVRWHRLEEVRALSYTKFNLFRQQRERSRGGHMSNIRRTTAAVMLRTWSGIDNYVLVHIIEQLH